MASSKSTGKSGGGKITIKTGGGGGKVTIHRGGGGKITVRGGGVKK
jgi:hypothetical protein